MTKINFKPGGLHRFHRIFAFFLRRRTGRFLGQKLQNTYYIHLFDFDIFQTTDRYKIEISSHH